MEKEFYYRVREQDINNVTQIQEEIEKLKENVLYDTFKGEETINYISRYLNDHLSAEPCEYDDNQEYKYPFQFMISEDIYTFTIYYIPRI